MAQLGIDPELIIKTQFKEYTDTLPEEEKDSFIDEMKESIGEQLQLQIDKAEELLTSVQDGCNNLISGAPSWMISAVTADPMAPVASAGTIASTVGAVKAAKSTIGIIGCNLSALLGMLACWRIPVPAPVTAAAALINTASAALNAIPI